VTSHAATGTPARGLQLERAPVVTGAVAALLAGAAFAKAGIGPSGVVAAFFVATLTLLSAIDLRHRILPNRIVLPAAGAVLVAHVAIAPERALEWVLAALGASLLLFLPLLVYPSGMGMGDVKLALLLGAGLGGDVFVALALGFVLVVPVGIVLLVRGGAAARKTAIPFGPFLAAGAVAVLFLA
jgi:leader peptidase (prepilin peptidase)/N-methyltransferase